MENFIQGVQTVNSIPDLRGKFVQHRVIWVFSGYNFNQISEHITATRILPCHFVAQNSNIIIGSAFRLGGELFHAEKFGFFGYDIVADRYFMIV